MKPFDGIEGPDQSKLDDSDIELHKSSLGMEGGDDDAAAEAQVEMEMDAATSFLMQIPPDWDKAEAHGRANLVIDGSKTELKLDDKESYCICCQMVYPEDEHYFPVCSDNMDLGSMGPGYPLFFELIKFVGFLMLILTIINFLPFAFLMYRSYQEMKDDLKPSDSVLALFSFGAFVQHRGEVGFEFLSYDTSKAHIMAVALIMAVSVFVSLIYLICMRHSLLKKVVKLDEDAHTPSDFCLMGTDMCFEDYAPPAISEKVKEVFKEKYDIEVEYVNPTYDISNFYSLSQKYNDLLK